MLVLQCRLNSWVTKETTPVSHATATTHRISLIEPPTNGVAAEDSDILVPDFAARDDDG